MKMISSYRPGFSVNCEVNFTKSNKVLKGVKGIFNFTKVFTLNQGLKRFFVDYSNFKT